MNDLAKVSSIQQLAAIGRLLPQLKEELHHLFAPGLYVRQAFYKAGTLVVGKKHRHEHLNIMLKGKIRFLNTNEEVQELEAPIIFVSPPGAKAALVIEDTVWVNVHPTNETDLEKIEEIFIDNSELEVA